MSDSRRTLDADLAEAESYANAGPAVSRQTVGRLVERVRRAEAALADARVEFEQIREAHRALGDELDEARNDARAAQQEARADVELLRAEIAVAARPDDPEGPRTG